MHRPCYRMIAPLLMILAASLLAGGNKKTYEAQYPAGNELALHLTIDAGDVRLERNETNECAVCIDYDEENCHVQVNYDDKDHELDVMVDHDNFDMATKKESNKSKYAVVRIKLPDKAVIDLDATIKAGEIQFIIGDLSIRNLELSGWAGEAKIDFDKPNRIPINRLDIDFKIGEVQLLHLGDACFKEADINSEIGSMLVDFSGSKMDTRAMARLDLTIGETTILLPKEIGVKMKVSKFMFLSDVDYPDWLTEKGSYYYSENYDDAPKTLYLSIGQGIGELKVKIIK
jgi:hypothetical protein